MAISRRMLPPLGRKDSKGLCDEQTKKFAGTKNERTRQESTSKGSSERRRSTSVCQVEAPKRPLAPLQVHIEVEDLHQDAEQKHMMVEPLGWSAEDLASTYRLQQRVLLPEVLDQDEGSKEKDFVDIEDLQVQGQFVVIPVQQPFPGLLQLRVFQKDFPDSIVAWNDWGRAARKDFDWLSRPSLPMPVDLPAPPPPRATVEVSWPDGSSLVVFLKFALPSQMSSWLGTTLRWQYRCRDATFGHGEDWCIDSFDSPIKAELSMQSPPLRGDWDYASAIFSVRYYQSAFGWSKWSESVPCSTLPAQEPIQVSICPCDETFTEATLTLNASAFGNSAEVENVKALQCRIEVQQDGTWQPVLATEQPLQEVLSCRVLHLRPGERHRVRVLTRRWRIDQQWQECIEDFKQPLTGAEYGIPPIQSVPDDILVGDPPEIGEESLEPRSWFSFWLPPMVAAWAAEVSFAEWRVEDSADSTWQLATFQRPLRRDVRKDSRFASGSGLRVLLPKVAKKTFVRLRHVCGLVTSSAAILPHFTAPSAPMASLVVQDSGLAIQLRVDGFREEHRHATMLQFKALSAQKTDLEEPETSGSGEELPVLSLACDISGAVGEQQYVVDLEELRQHLGKMAFCARIGNDCRWSDWSPTSDFLDVHILPPHARGELPVYEREKGVAEVLWPRFEVLEGLTQIIYEVFATCSCYPEENTQLLLPEVQALGDQSDGNCRAVFTRLVPDTKYEFVVRGVYPKLKRYFPQDSAVSDAFTLKASLHLSGVDADEFEPPLPVKQVAPPPLHGGADRRSPWSLEFWLEVDQKALPFGEAYKIEWRPWQADDLWQDADLQLTQVAGIRSTGDGLKLCIWQFPGTINSPNLPTAVEFRARQIDIQPYGRSGKPGSSRTWLSQISGPYATAFAAPEKPRVSLQVGQHLAVVLAFALYVQSSESQIDDEKMPTAQLLKPGHGHGLVTRVQVCFRQAGDSHDTDDISELKPQEMDSASVSLSRDGCCTVKIGASQPQFLDGQRILFAARVGDYWRWSPWSSFSKPVHMKHPVLQLTQDQSIVVKPLSPDTVSVSVRYPSLATDSPEMVEYFISMAPLGPTGREVKSSSQLIALAREQNLQMDAGNEVEVYVGSLRSVSFQFKLLVRSQCHTLGAPVFEEVARSTLLWPQPRLVDGSVESWDLPIPRLLAVPEELEATSGRWRSRAALLAWPKGVQVCEDPPLELQACAWREGVQIDSRHSEAPGDAALDLIDPDGWVPVSWSLIQLHGLPCIAASQLPFSCCRLRWYSCDRRVAGPHSEACLTFIDSPVEVTSEVFCTISAVKVKASFEMPSIPSSIPFCQWRVGSVKASRTEDGMTWSDVEEWQVLDLMSVASCSRSCSKGGRQSLGCVLGEEDGLELGSCYVFSARIGDGRRSSIWSTPSAPVVFDIPDTDNPAPSGAGPHKLLIEPLAVPRVEAPEMPSLNGFVFGRPSLEYRLDVSRCVADGGLERHCTILLSDKDTEEDLDETDRLDGPYTARRPPCEAQVNGLCPGAQYFASLAVRFSMLGRRDWRRTGITATFGR